MVSIQQTIVIVVTNWRLLEVSSLK